jgi:hypothetical protein
MWASGSSRKYVPAAALAFAIFMTISPWLLSVLGASPPSP